MAIQDKLHDRLDDAVRGDVSTPSEAKAILNNKGIDSFDPSYKLRFAYLLEDPTGRGGVKKSVVLHNLDEHQSFEDDLDKKMFGKSDKEPWQMTRAEYRKYGSELYDKLGNREYVNTPFHNYSENVPHEYFDESMGKYPNNSVNQAHYRAIKKAIADGKSVPASVLVEYPDLAGKSVPDATHGKSVKQIASSDEIESWGWGKNRKRPNLDNVVELHPSNGSWRNFLKDAELLETKNGIKHYISSNGYYIVLPDGEVIVFYGYHGQSAFDELVKDKDGWLKRRAVAEHEMDELLHPTAKSEKSEPISISATEASDAGRELSTYGQQKRKYKVTNHKGKSSRKSQHTSTGLGSAR